MLLLGKLKPDSGQIDTFGTISLLYQQIQFNPYLTCYEILLLEKDRNSNGADINISDLFKDLNLIDYRNHLAKDLSGGQQQLLTVGMYLARGASIILADEPYSRMDSLVSEKVKEKLNMIVNKHEITLLVASHHFPHFKGFDDVFKIENYGLFKNN
ncbi:MAG: ABC transporter ATP-binding protein YtrE [Candidatus Heimdallarchaeota archaeon LC_3]|nr:MAG: ABC transporter ATP-binding protein YtrE [Candidatus Heimdallarchaeota archaeon LC_3]